MPHEDNFRIYNQALTLDEISQNYHAINDRDVITKGLISWWKLDGMGKLAQDSIGGYDGIIYGAKWMNTASHLYTHPGTYEVNLTVWNDYGLHQTISQNIVIS